MHNIVKPNHIYLNRGIRVSETMNNGRRGGAGGLILLLLFFALLFFFVIMPAMTFYNNNDWWLNLIGFKLPFGSISGSNQNSATWPVAQHDAQHTGRSGDANTIYVGSSGFYVDTINAIFLNGTLKWKYRLTDNGATMSSSLIVAPDGTIYVPCGLAGLDALNPNGTLKWTTYPNIQLPEYDVPAPALGADGTIYIVTSTYPNGQSYFMALYPSGTMKWQHKISDNYGATVSPIIGSDGTIYIGSGNLDGSYYLFAFNPDGTIKWEFNIGNGRILGSPALASDGTIYFTEYNQSMPTNVVIEGKPNYPNYLYAVHPDGTLKWRMYVYQDGSMCDTPVIASDGTIYIGTDDQYILDWADGRNLYAINPDGSIKWGIAIQDNPPSVDYSGERRGITIPAIGSDGTIYVMSLYGCEMSPTPPLSQYYNEHLWAINPDGTLKWKYWVPNLMYVQPPSVGPNGIIYAMSDVNNTLFAINSDGTLQWHYYTGLPHFSPVLVIAPNTSTNTPTPKYTLMMTVTISGNGTAGTVSPSPGSHQYLSGTSITLSATPSSDSNFTRFEINGVAQTQNPLPLTMDKNYTVSVIFTSMTTTNPPSFFDLLWAFIRSWWWIILILLLALLGIWLYKEENDTT